MNPASVVSPHAPSFSLDQVLAWGEEETKAISAVLSSIPLAVRMADSLPAAANLHTVRHLAEQGDAAQFLKVLPHCGIDEQLKREAAPHAPERGSVFGPGRDVTLSASLTAAAAAGRLYAVAELLAVMAPYLPACPGSRLYQGCEQALVAAAEQGNVQVLRRFDEALVPQDPKVGPLWNEALLISLRREGEAGYAKGYAKGYATDIILPHAQPHVVIQTLERQRFSAFAGDRSKVSVKVSDFGDLSTWGAEARAVGEQVDASLRQLKERGFEPAPEPPMTVAQALKLKGEQALERNRLSASTGDQPKADVGAAFPPPKPSFLRGCIDRLMLRRQEGVRTESEVAPRSPRPR